MSPLALALAVLLLVVTGYLVVVLRQITAMRRQLEQQLDGDAHRPVTLALVVPPLEQLAARVNDAVRRAQEASTRTRREERRIRSFIADISHDLRTPLTTVRGYLQLLERTALDDSQREQLEAAQRQAEELGVLVDRLYEYAYLLEVDESLTVEPVDVGVLVAECLLGMTGPIEGAGLAVEAAPPTGLRLATDREKLTRIVQNLLRNAVQHGRDTLAVEVTEDGTGGVELRVTNGVAPGAEIDAARVFERFYTADRSRSGRTSGLGLSIVEVLTGQLGGRARARHDPEAGTLQISVRIPPATA
ncbi:HAMP domain-containing sensor histidine kinase [Brachybacterium sp. YJGR34]|uniref:sensor histidine kinase n=1 Tax=Brachybacterium sp. YJGR34 TaxID=2059911 RepID=UPI000E0A73B8|nr:HAMP domain-containing sensor histidine kinase [Brachybacterium sp. YJGR34]